MQAVASAWRELLREAARQHQTRQQVPGISNEGGQPLLQAPWLTDKQRCLKGQASLFHLILMMPRGFSANRKVELSPLGAHSAGTYARVP